MIETNFYDPFPRKDGVSSLKCDLTIFLFLVQNLTFITPTVVAVVVATVVGLNVACSVIDRVSR